MNTHFSDYCSYFSDYCCICGKKTVCYDNPDPVRSDLLDCCSACNRLVIKARRKLYNLPREEQNAYALQLKSMSYTELIEELGRDTTF